MSRKRKSRSDPPLTLSNEQHKNNGGATEWSQFVTSVDRPLSQKLDALRLMHQCEQAFFRHWKQKLAPPPIAGTQVKTLRQALQRERQQATLDACVDAATESRFVQLWPLIAPKITNIQSQADQQKQRLKQLQHASSIYNLDEWNGLLLAFRLLSIPSCSASESCSDVTHVDVSVCSRVFPVLVSRARQVDIRRARAGSLLLYRDLWLGLLVGVERGETLVRVKVVMIRPWKTRDYNELNGPRVPPWDGPIQRQLAASDQFDDFLRRASRHCQFRHRIERATFFTNTHSVRMPAWNQTQHKAVNKSANELHPMHGGQFVWLYRVHQLLCQLDWPAMWSTDLSNLVAAYAASVPSGHIVGQVTQSSILKSSKQHQAVEHMSIRQMYSVTVDRDRVKIESEGESEAGLESDLEWSEADSDSEIHNDVELDSDVSE